MRQTVVIIVSVVLLLATACGSAARVQNPFSVKQVVAAFAKEGFTLVPTPPNRLGSESATALAQKPWTGKGLHRVLHAQDFVVFVFSKIAVANSARTHAAASAFARNSIGRYGIRANLVVVWEVRSYNSREVAAIKRAMLSVKG